MGSSLSSMMEEVEQKHTENQNLYQQITIVLGQLLKKLEFLNFKPSRGNSSIRSSSTTKKCENLTLVYKGRLMQFNDEYLNGKPYGVALIDFPAIYSGVKDDLCDRITEYYEKLYRFAEDLDYDLYPETIGYENIIYSNFTDNKFDIIGNLDDSEKNLAYDFLLKLETDLESFFQKLLQGLEILNADTLNSEDQDATIESLNNLYNEYRSTLCGDLFSLRDFYWEPFIHKKSKKVAYYNAFYNESHLVIPKFTKLYSLDNPYFAKLQECPRPLKYSL